MRVKDDQYSPAETARRRDEVIRRKVNTPPQPHDKPNPRQSGKKKPTASRHKTRKSGDADKAF